jgi:hypothetical protein
VPHDGCFDPIDFRDIQSQSDYQLILTQVVYGRSATSLVRETVLNRDYTYN